MSRRRVATEGGVKVEGHGTRMEARIPTRESNNTQG